MEDYLELRESGTYKEWVYVGGGNLVLIDLEPIRGGITGGHDNEAMHRIKMKIVDNKLYEGAMRMAKALGINLS